MSRTLLSLWRGVITAADLRPMLADLADEVSEETGVSVPALRGPSRKRDIAWPRQRFCAYALSRRFQSTKIARFLNRDHSTVIYSARRHWERECS